MAKKLSGSSRPEKLVRKRLEDIKLTAEQLAQMEALKNMPDSEIDYSDIPEITDFTGWQRGVHFRPIKTQISLRVDSDILHWFKVQGKNYQTRMNEALRAYVTAAEKSLENGRVREAGAAKYQATVQGKEASKPKRALKTSKKSKR